MKNYIEKGTLEYVLCCINIFAICIYIKMLKHSVICTMDSLNITYQAIKENN